MPVVCKYPDNWDDYWDEEWEDLLAQADSFWGGDEEDLWGFFQGLWDNINNSSGGNNSGGGNYWTNYFALVRYSPTTINPGDGWVNSAAEQVYNDLRKDSPTFDNMMKRFENQTDGKLSFHYTNNYDFKLAVLGILLGGPVNPNDPVIKPILEAAKKALGSTFISPYVQNNTTVFKADAHVNINSNVLDLNGNPITLNNIGLALSIIHESIHAEYILDTPKSNSFMQSQDHQHDDMAHNHRQEIEDALREYLTAQNITLQTTPIDEVELLSWIGLLQTHEGMDYIINYAQVVHGVTFTITDKNNLTPQEIANLNQYSNLINQRIYGLIQ